MPGAGPGGSSPGYANLLPAGILSALGLGSLINGMPDAVKRAGTDGSVLDPSAQREMDWGDRLRHAFGGGPSSSGTAGHPDDDRATRARSSDADAWKQQQDMIRAASQQFGALNTHTGLVLTSFDGLKSNALALSGGMGGTDNALKILEATAIGAARALAQVALSGGMTAGGGSGFMNASFGGGGGFGGRSINGNAIGGEYTDKGSFNQKAPGVMANLMRDFNIDAAGAAKIMGNLGHESGGLQAFGERGGGSGIGWAQWTGPRNREFQAWAAEHGLDPHSDAANYGMLKHDLEGRYSGVIAAIKRGAPLEEVERMYEGAGIKAYGSRHAYERAALDAYNHRSAPVAGAPPTNRTVAPGKPAAGQITAENMPPIVINHRTVLDGKTIHQSTIRHLASSSAFPRDMGGPDNHGSYLSPGTPVTDAA